MSDKKALLKKWGEALHKERETHKMSSNELGERVGVHGASICNWEKAHNCPSLFSYHNVLKVFPSLKSEELESCILRVTKPDGNPASKGGSKMGKKHVQHAAPVRSKKQETPAAPVKAKETGAEQILLTTTQISRIAELHQERNLRDLITLLENAGASPLFILNLLKDLP